jgi:hypothetical protein
MWQMAWYQGLAIVVALYNATGLISPLLNRNEEVRQVNEPLTVATRAPALPPISEGEIIKVLVRVRIAVAQGARCEATQAPGTEVDMRNRQ